MWGPGWKGRSPFDIDSTGCHLGSSTLSLSGMGDEYPRGSSDRFLHFGAIWIGAVTEENDTLVSVGHDGIHINYEFYPDVGPNGEIVAMSAIDHRQTGNVRSDQDIIAAYCDTFTKGVPGLGLDYLTGQNHHPLWLNVTERSMQWANPLVDDFILTEFKIVNIGLRDLSDVYFGICMIPAVGHSTVWPGISDSLQGSDPSGDDVCGYLNLYPFRAGDCQFDDTLNMAWAVDNDGDPNSELQWLEAGNQKSNRGIAGLRVIAAPGGPNRNFNWWTPHYYDRLWQTDWAKLDYGPRKRPPSGLSPRDFLTGGVGDPLGDANKYYIMSNGEIDIDQARVGQILPNDPTWEYPTEYVRDRRIWSGESIAYLLSLGPFDLVRGQEESIVIAYVAAPDFHKDPTNGLRLYNQQLDAWYSHLDFAPLAKHAKMAEWVYDNPGFDTDGDGYAGKSHICVIDSSLVDGRWVASVAETTFYAGDGVADWRAPGAPPAPKFWLHPYDHGIRIRFNGSKSETAKDIVSNRVDFEGFRVYLGRDEREGSLVLSASYDLHNYDKYVWNPKRYPFGAYEVQEIPMTLDQIRCLYGRGETPCQDSLFDPLAYTQDNPYRMPRFFEDSAFYFVQHGHNAGRLGIDTPIRKLYPNALKPIPGEPIPDSAYTEDGYLKYYEYECIIDGLLPTVPYYVNVTAFDFGDPAGGVEALESSKLLGLQDCYALENANQTGAKDKPVYIYPNPYRADAKYREMGYEGRGSDRINDRERRIHFANLPAKCWIRIHTLDGDMVREIRHDMDPNDPASDHDTWDMINRNIMAVESGLYYWSVEPDDGKVQIGKLVIIR
jgi:hypothetical protein